MRRRGQIAFMDQEARAVGIIVLDTVIDHIVNIIGDGLVEGIKE
jgi:hypothetical protein